MNKIKFALKNIAAMALIITSFIACDKDFATVGSDIIGQNNFGVRSTTDYPIVAYTNPLEPIQTNNLPLNYLGAYYDPLYGLMTASFVSQMGTSLVSPNFGEGVELDSVVLTVPYFSRRTEINSEGETIYELDSIYGEGSINLEFFENKYFLNNVDPNSEFDTPLTYYSNMTSNNGTISSSLLQGEPLLLLDNQDPPTNIISNFRPSNREIKLLDEDDEVTSRLAPSLRVKLQNEYWEEKFLSLEAEDPVLSNSNNFNNYFRGIYIKASLESDNGSLALLNFGSSAANITVYYTKNPNTTDGDRIASTFVLTFTGNRVNFIENQLNFTIPEGNPVTGDERLYLKGAEGSTAVVDLFNAGDYEDGFSPEFMNFKNDFVETDLTTGKFKKAKRLVNEANLVFYVDQQFYENQGIGQSEEPDRVYLYDLKNNIPLYDYYLDVVNTSNPNNSKTNHLGMLQRENGEITGNGVKYKIKITEHINNLLIRDSTNVKLGLAVSSNVNLENSGSIPTPQYKLLTGDDDNVQKVPLSSILSPRGTVLYGTNTPIDDKKLKLEIFYTCLNTDDNCED